MVAMLRRFRKKATCDPLCKKWIQAITLIAAGAISIIELIDKLR